MTYYLFHLPKPTTKSQSRTKQPNHVTSRPPDLSDRITVAEHEMRSMLSQQDHRIRQLEFEAQRNQAWQANFARQYNVFFSSHQNLQNQHNLFLSRVESFINANYPNRGKGIFEKDGVVLSAVPILTSADIEPPAFILPDVIEQNPSQLSTFKRQEDTVSPQVNASPSPSSSSSNSPSSPNSDIEYQASTSEPNSSEQLRSQHSKRTNRSTEDHSDQKNPKHQRPNDVGYMKVAVTKENVTTLNPNHPKYPFPVGAPVSEQLEWIDQRCQNVVRLGYHPEANLHWFVSHRDQAFKKIIGDKNIRVPPPNNQTGEHFTSVMVVFSGQGVVRVEPKALASKIRILCAEKNLGELYLYPSESNDAYLKQTCFTIRMFGRNELPAGRPIAKVIQIDLDDEDIAFIPHHQRPGDYDNFFYARAVFTPNLNLNNLPHRFDTHFDASVRLREMEKSMEALSSLGRSNHEILKAAQQEIQAIIDEREEAKRKRSARFRLMQQALIHIPKLQGRVLYDLCSNNSERATMILWKAKRMFNQKLFLDLINQGLQYRGGSIKESYLHIVAWKGSIGILRLILSSNCDPDIQFKSVKPSIGGTPLIYATLNAAVVEILLAAGANKDATDNYGRTPMHRAAVIDNAVVVELLLAAGANKDATDEDGRTPMHLAAGRGNAVVVELLLAAGANKNATDKKGRTPMHYAAKYEHAAIVELLLGAGANNDAADKNGWTPMHFAIDNGHFAVVELLLGSGANKDATNRGRTSMHYAAGYGHAVIVKILLAVGADISILPNLKIS